MSPSRVFSSEEKGSRILHETAEVIRGRCVIFCLDRTVTSVSSVLEISFRRAEYVRQMLIPKRLRQTDSYLYVVSSEDVLLLDDVMMGTF